MSDIKQLTNGMYEMVFGSGNGHFYHISVIEFTISWDLIC